MNQFLGLTTIPVNVAATVTVLLTLWIFVNTSGGVIYSPLQKERETRWQLRSGQPPAAVAAAPPSSSSLPLQLAPHAHAPDVPTVDIHQITTYTYPERLLFTPEGRTVLE